MVIIEVFAGGEQIPESPFRLQIEARDCSDTPDSGFRVANSYGECVCEDSTASIGDTCVPTLSMLLPCIFVPIVGIIAYLVYRYVDKKSKQADSVWKVEADELDFQVPPKVLGRATFGLVLLAEYRGTQVAVKRVLPPKGARSGGRGLRS